MENYYGELKTMNIKPINKDYIKIKNVNHLYELLTKCWSKETCSARLRNDFNENNKTCGQCSITSFLVQDIFGGDVYGILLEDGNYHCYNYVDNIIFDLTSAQFNYPLVYQLENKQDKQAFILNKDKYQRYLLLKEKLDYLINKDYNL